MPNSLKARLKKLKYQGVLSQEDIDRIVILPNAEKVTKNSTMMTNEEASKHLKAKLECLTRSKGFCGKCDSYNSYEGCYECDLGHKQGNIGEQIESLKSAIRALEQENMLDKIRDEIAEYKDDKAIHDERNEIIDIVLDIIDKYKVKSEG